MAVLAPPVQVVTSGAPPFVHVPSGAPPFVVTTGPAPPIQIVASGAPPITLYNEDGSLWAGGGGAAVGGAALLTGEANGFATDFLYATDAQRVALKTAGTVVSSGLSFFTNSGTSSKWVFNAAGLLVNIPVGTLALDYDPVTHAAKGLLCEPQATNNQTRSSDFTTSWGPNETTVSANAVTAPNGLAEADAIIPANVVGGRPFVNWTSTTTAATVTTYSLFAKNGTLGNNWIEVQIGGAPTVAAWFNLATGVKGTSTGSPISYTITAVGNGWYRLTVTFTAGAGSAATYLCADSGDGIDSGNGNGTSPAFYLWGTQMEAGTVATSYIATTSATVTRAGDNVTALPAAIGISATTGTWWVDVNILRVVPGGSYNRVLGYSSNFSPIFMNAGTTFTQYDTPGFLGNVVVPTVVGSHKVSSALQSGNWAITADGLSATTVTTVGALSSPTLVGFGLDPTGGGLDNMHGYIRQLRYVPRRKSGAEMITETT